MLEDLLLSTHPVQLTVDAVVDRTRIGSSFSISGSTTDGSTAGAVSAGTITSGCTTQNYYRYPRYCVQHLSVVHTQFDALPTSDHCRNCSTSVRLLLHKLELLALLVL